MIVQPRFLSPLFLALIFHTSVGAAPSPRHKTPANAPDLAAIVRLAVEKNTTRTRQIEDFAYTELMKRRIFSSRGKAQGQETYTFQTVLIHGSHYRRLVQHNGRSLAGGEAIDEQQREMEFVKTMKADAQAHGIMNAAYLKATLQFPFAQLTNQFSFTLKSTKTVRGNKTYVIGAFPRPDYQPSTEEQKLAQNFKLTLWIDQADNEIVQAQGEVIAEGMVYHPNVIALPEQSSDKLVESLMSNTLSYLPGTVLTEEWTKINGELWLPSRIHIKGHISFNNATKPAGLPMENEVVYSGYEKFHVSTHITPN